MRGLILGLFRVFNFQASLPWAYNHQLPFKVIPLILASAVILTPGAGDYSWVLLLVNYASLYQSFCLSRFWAVVCPWGLSSLMNLQRDVDFQFVRLFSCCGDLSDDFRAVYVWDQKVEVLNHSLSNCEFFLIIFRNYEGVLVLKISMVVDYVTERSFDLYVKIL